MSGVVLVTGAAGFVGTHLLASLTAAAAPARIVAWRRPGSPDVRPARTPPDGVTWQDVDLLARDVVTAAIEDIRPAHVFHCGGVASVAGSWTGVVDTLAGNVLGTRYLLTALRRARVPARVLVPGSALVYRPRRGLIRESDPIGPVSPYGVSKLAQEIQAGGLASPEQQVILTRSFTHVGPGQGLSYATSSFAHQIARAEWGHTDATIRVGRLDAERDLMDVRDTVRAYRALMTGGTPGRPYNVCSGVTHRMQDVLDGLIARARVPVRVTLDQSRVRATDYPELRGDRSRITTEVGWVPRIALDQTLADVLDHWRAVVDGRSPSGSP